MAKARSYGILHFTLRLLVLPSGRRWKVKGPSLMHKFTANAYKRP
jgi:hypothetical protein